MLVTGVQVTWKDIRDKFYWWKFMWHIRESDSRRRIQGFSWDVEIIVTPLLEFGLDERSGVWCFHLGWFHFWWDKPRRQFTREMLEGNPTRKRQITPEGGLACDFCGEIFEDGFHLHRRCLEWWYEIKKQRKGTA